MTGRLIGLWRASQGAALIEFALTAPVALLMAMGLGDLAYQLYMQSVLSGLVQKAGRDATIQNANTGTLDITVLTRMQGSGINLTGKGRIIISSLENVQQTYDTTPVQRSHWQRCVGVMGGTGYDSSYGTTTTAGTDTTLANTGTATALGMGDTGYLVNAPSGYGVMFVEVNYACQGLFGTMYIPATRIHYLASYVVRDRRDYSQIYNPSPTATRSTCNLYTG